MNLNLSGAAKVVKPSVAGNNSKGATGKNVQSSRSSADVGKLVEEILNKTSKLLLSEVKTNACTFFHFQTNAILSASGWIVLAIQINDETIKTHGDQLGTVVSDKLQKNLISDFKNLAVSIWPWPCLQIFPHFKNQCPPYMKKLISIFFISITILFLQLIMFRITKVLSLDSFLLQMIFKSTAYTEGFHAGTLHQPKRWCWGLCKNMRFVGRNTKEGLKF